MARVVHFEIQADDVEGSKAFFGGVFDWSFHHGGELTGATYWGTGTNAFVCTMQVEDYDAVEARILAPRGAPSASTSRTRQPRSPGGGQSLMASMPCRFSSSRWSRIPCSTSGGCPAQPTTSPTTRSGSRVR